MRMGLNQNMPINGVPKERNYVIPFIIAAVLFLAVFAGFLFFIIRKNQTAQINPRTQQKIVEPVDGTGSELGDYTKEELLENRGYKLSVLGSILPYNGKYFTLTYNLEEDEFTLYMDPNFQKEGNEEFSLYLKQNGIKDVSWIENLKKTTNKP